MAQWFQCVDYHTRVSFSIQFIGSIPPTVGVDNSTYDCIIAHPGALQVFGTSTLFPDIELARRNFEIITTVPSKHLPIPKHCAYVNTGGAVVVVERLFSIHSWVPTSSNLWKLDGYRIISLGADFLRVVGEILTAHEDLHDRGIRHGNVLCGVYFDVNNTVKLTNFIPNEGPLTGEEVKNDLIAIRQLCDAVVFQSLDAHNMQRSEDVALFNALFDFDQYPHVQDSGYHMFYVGTIAKFLYHLPMFWKIGGVGTLIKAISSLDKKKNVDNKAAYDKILVENFYPAHYWPQVITQNQQLLGVYLYYPPSENPPINPPWYKKYNEPKGFSIFTRHAVEHAGWTPSDGVNLLMKEFSGIGLKLLLSLLCAESLHYTVRVVNGTPTPLHVYVYQLMMVAHKTWNDSPGQTSRTPCCLH